MSAAILPWVPFLLMTALFGGWIIVSPTNISSRDPRLFYFLMGVVFSNISVSYDSCITYQHVSYDFGTGIN